MQQLIVPAAVVQRPFQYAPRNPPPNSNPQVPSVNARGCCRERTNTKKSKIEVGSLNRLARRVCLIVCRCGVCSLSAAPKGPRRCRPRSCWRRGGRPGSRARRSRCCLSSRGWGRSSCASGWWRGWPCPRPPRSTCWATPSLGWRTRCDVVVGCGRLLWRLRLFLRTLSSWSSVWCGGWGCSVFCGDFGNLMRSCGSLLSLSLSFREDLVLSRQKRHFIAL